MILWFDVMISSNLCCVNKNIFIICSIIIEHIMKYMNKKSTFEIFCLSCYFKTWLQIQNIEFFQNWFTYSLQNAPIKYGQRDFGCPICSKRCNTKQHMEKHIRTHTGEQPYACQICQKRFNDFSNCRRHIKQCQSMNFFGWIKLLFFATLSKLVFWVVHKWCHPLGGT